MNESGEHTIVVASCHDKFARPVHHECNSFETYLVDAKQISSAKENVVCVYVT